MNPDIKRRWVRALRSGLYVQGTGTLTDSPEGAPSTNTFCCLGVLACVMHPDARPLDACETCKDDDDEILSPATLDHAELEPVQMRALVQQNDQEGKTFTQIADYIEDNL